MDGGDDLSEAEGAGTSTLMLKIALEGERPTGSPVPSTRRVDVAEAEPVLWPPGKALELLCWPECAPACQLRRSGSLLRMQLHQEVGIVGFRAPPITENSEVRRRTNRNPIESAAK